MNRKADLIEFKNSDINIKSISLLYRERKLMPWKHDRPSMAHYYIGFILEGSLFLTTGEKSFDLKKGDLIFVKKGIDYHSRSRELPFSFISIEFEIYEDEYYSFEFQECYHIKNTEKVQAIMEELYSAWKDKRAGNLLRQKIHMYRLLDQILKEDSALNESYEYKKIKKAVDYMEKNFLEEYTDIQKLADLCELSTSRFTRIFKSIYNTTPTKYMNFLRIERAKKLLSETDLQISVISEMSGFTSMYYFSRLFKKVTGTSPLKYRENNYS